VKRSMLLVGATLAACSAPDGPLVSPDQIIGDAVPDALTQQAGDPVRGAQVFIDRESGHCVLCHVVSGLDVEFQGDIGPNLSTIGDRLSLGQLRLRVIDYQLLRPGALMPSYYRIHDLHQVADEYDGLPILTAQDVEDIVAYLAERKAIDEDA